MKRRLLPTLLAVALLLGGCAHSPAEDEKLHILATTYPMYLFTTALTEGVNGVEVELLVNSQTSCLHDYTLTVENMKAIERSDVIVMNGAGLEDFMTDALAHSNATVIDCSEGIDLLPTLERGGYEGHEHEEEQDPHYWMDPTLAGQAVETIARGLALLDTDHAESYGQAAVSAGETLYELNNRHRKLFAPIVAPGGGNYLPGAPGFITFHDGFQYFADFSGLELLKAIEEEEGSTASAAEIKEIVALISEYNIPAIFVEKNGSRSTAEVISRETGCKIYELDMLMSGDGTGLQPYFDAMTANRTAIQEALQ